MKINKMTLNEMADRINELLCELTTNNNNNFMYDYYELMCLVEVIPPDSYFDTYDKTIKLRPETALK